MKKLSVLIFITVLQTVSPSYKVGKPYMVLGKWYHPREYSSYKEVGVASWYGGKFHKNKTANGEVFYKNKLSGAHKTLPLPSIVRVTNLENGKKLTLRINDRGPFVGNRIIDVSEKAAKVLDFHRQGIAKVEVKLDKKATEKLLKSSSLKCA